ncbi:MAG: helix-turn-helix domain-containing protein [Hyphomicrobiales bacterium]|nr:helix-turn-helix domain-containing protein [Hyphomicrobiales bacterium]
MKCVADVLDRNIKIIGADPLSQRGFTQIPNVILKSSKISGGAKLAYAMLLSYAMQKDECFPGQDRLGVDMGVSRQTANQYVKELELKGFINIRRRGQGKSNLYEINLKAKVLRAAA